MLHFRSAKDLIWPFTAIGDEGWENGVQSILEAAAEEWGAQMPPPVSEEKLVDTEKRLGTAIPPSLRLFLKRFGVADIGEELQHPDNMVSLAQWAEGMELEEFMAENERTATADLITFSEHLGIGNVFCFHRTDHSVHFFDHDTSPHLEKLFDSVDDYLKGCLIKVQDIFFAPAISDPESLVEEELVRIFGEKTVVKWLY